MDDYDVDAVLQRALDRLSLLAEATTVLSSTLDAHEALQRVCRILVPQMGDWCAVDLLEEDGRPRRVAVAHRDAQALPAAAPTGLLPPVPETARGPLARVLHGAGPLLVGKADFESPDRVTDSLQVQQLELFRRLGADSAVIAPLRARRQVLGALTIARVGDRPPLSGDDLALVDDLAHRIALAADNARLHAQTLHIAERLQRSLLPGLPDVDHLQLAARYSPAASTAEVGGDWYDSFLLPQGNITLIIGDVTGHDLRAAVTMSQLRNMLRGIATDRQEPPAQILRRLDRAHHALYPHATATCIYALVTGPEGGPWKLHYASAGHLPPLLVTHDGDTQYLHGEPGLLLGVSPDAPRQDATEPLPADGTLLLYTDGLVERRGESLDASLTRLRQHAAALAREPVEVFCDELISGLVTDHNDDVALLALRLPGPGIPSRTDAHRTDTRPRT